MYVKLFSDILDSSLWAEDAETCKVWITLLAMSNQAGLVRATLPGISNRARIDPDKTALILKDLESPDANSRTTDSDGRRIERTDGGYLILNYEKYRTFRDEDARRASDRVRQQRHRAKVSRPVTPPSRLSLQAEAEAEAEADKRNVNSAPPPLERTDETAMTMLLSQYARHNPGTEKSAWVRERFVDLLKAYPQEAIQAAIEAGPKGEKSQAIADRLNGVQARAGPVSQTPRPKPRPHCADCDSSENGSLLPTSNGRMVCYKCVDEIAARRHAPAHVIAGVKLPVMAKPPGEMTATEFHARKKELKRQAVEFESRQSAAGNVGAVLKGTV